MEGKIARGLGDRRRAEDLFRQVRASFTAEGLGFHAALAGLDLALLYVEQGKTTEVKQLAEEMLPIIMAQDVHREAAAALVLFGEAAQREAVTASMLSELIAYMRRVRVKCAEGPS